MEDHPVDGFDEVATEEVAVDGEIFSLDNETGLYKKREETQESVKKTRRKWLKKKEPIKEVAPETKAEPVAANTDEELPTALGSFGASFLNFCTFGLISSGDTTVEEENNENGLSADKIVEDLALGEAQLTMVDEETAMTSDLSPRQVSLVEEAPSVHNSSVAESKTQEPMISSVIKQRNKQSIVTWSIGIFVFLVMCG